MVIPWVGFPLGDLLKRFEPNGNAQFVPVHDVLRPQEMPTQRPANLRNPVHGHTRRACGWMKRCIP